MILDFGCGDARRWDRERDNIVGVDINLPRLRQAKTRISVVRCDGRTLPFASSIFSTIISDSVLEHIQGYQKALLEMKRVLGYGGTCRIFQPVDNDPIFIVARRMARSWMGDRVYSFFNSSRLLSMMSSLFKVNSVNYVPNSPFAGLFGFFNKKAPHALQMIDRSYDLACRRTGFFHWMIIIEAIKELPL
jgi:ubiquinone/menaquinone biosynthesis C-methylase UbiE